ncbi:MAG: hypothetical protein ACEPO8_11415 [Rhodothermaceae bacterium]
MKVLKKIGLIALIGTLALNIHLTFSDVSTDDLVIPFIQKNVAHNGDTSCNHAILWETVEFDCGPPHIGNCCVH